MGAWIETFSLFKDSYNVSVAPYVGAWIETRLPGQVYDDLKVAPYVGAWIETSNVLNVLHIRWSHPMWVRGLKQRQASRQWRVDVVAPYVGAWIETP